MPELGSRTRPVIKQQRALIARADLHTSQVEFADFHHQSPGKFGDHSGRQPHHPDLPVARDIAIQLRISQTVPHQRMDVREVGAWFAADHRPYELRRETMKLPQTGQIAAADRPRHHRVQLARGSRHTSISRTTGATKVRQPHQHRLGHTRHLSGLFLCHTHRAS
jgi:hypothetical protein